MFIALFSISARRACAALMAFVILASLPAFASQKEAEAIARRVDARYNNLRSLTASFHERYEGPGIVREESGLLSLKKPGKMRWDYALPREKLFITDGSKAYFYVPADRQVRKADVKKLDDLRSPIRFLLGRARLAREFENLEVASGVPLLEPGNVVLVGTPKHLKDRVERVLLEVTPRHHLARITIYEVDGTLTEFRFTDFVENSAIPDSRFKFSPPAGVETIEGLAVAP